jgi:hypothetical protein
MSMSLDDAIFWIAITVFGAGLYLVPEFKAWGLMLMVGGAAGVLYSIRAHVRRPERPRGIMVVLMILTWAVVGYDIYERHTTKGLSRPFTPQYLNQQLSPNWGSYKYEDVYNHPFANETVRLDGKRFLGCTFDNVTFVYQGTAPFTFLPYPPKITGANRVQSDVQIVELSFNALLLIGCPVEVRNDLVP